MPTHEKTDDGPLAWLARVKNAVAWLAGATAGLSALLYASGFLVMRAHLSMLGLYGFADPDNDDYLQEGAKFFDVSITEASTAVMYMSLVALPVIGLCVLLRPWLQRPRVGWPRMNALAGFVNRHYRLALYALAFACLADILVTDVHALTRPLCIENLLYQSRAVSAVCAKDAEATKLLGELIRRDATGLAVRYEDALMSLARAALLCVLAAWLCAPWRWRQSAFAPFILGVVVIALLLPMNYGVIRREPRYPRVDLALADATATPPASPLYLLSHKGGDWVVWSAPAGTVLWLPGAAVARATISTIDDPLKAALAFQEKKP